VSIALGIQHAKLMPRIILSSVVCPAIPCIYTHSHKWQEFWRKKHFWTKQFVFIFSTTDVW